MQVDTYQVLSQQVLHSIDNLIEEVVYRWGYIGIHSTMIAELCCQRWKAPSNSSPTGWGSARCSARRSSSTRSQAQSTTRSRGGTEKSRTSRRRSAPVSLLTPPRLRSPPPTPPTPHLPAPP